MVPRVRAAGSAVGPFRLERLLGGGHDTEVWRADGDGIIVALKLLRPGADALARARLAREGALLAGIAHDAIGALLEAGEADGEPYLAFALHDAGTLATAIDGGRLAPAVAAATLAPIADALAYVHALGVVHRDVKPANVLCTPDGPVLVDFSIASITGSTYDGWIDGAPAVAGTEGYRAPEAGTVEPDAAEDVYALGVSLLEAVTGRRARVDDAARALLGPLAPIVDACVAVDASARPTAEIVAGALREVAGSSVPPVVPAPESTVIDIRDWSERTTLPARASEIARLVGAVNDGVDADELRAVLVVAPAGAGKTWLVTNAMAVADAGPVRHVVHARCTEATGDVSVLRPWVQPLLDRTADAVESMARVVGRAPAAQVARALGLARGVTGGVADAAVVADALAALLASGGPVVAVVEDLHHASLELLDVLSRLALRDGVPGAIWATTRPGLVDADDLDFSTLALEPLDDAAIGAVVADAISDATDRVVAQVVAVAGGNPLHAREAALAARRGDGAGSPGSLGSLPDLIDSRFASFDDATRDALEVAAACGDAFWPEALGGPLLAAAPLLYQSGVAQVRMTSSVAGSTEAGWSHPLLQEVAYRRLTPARARHVHASLGAALDEIGASAEVVARQAGAAFRLGDVASAGLAGRAAALAARDALDRFALSGAATWIELVRDSGHEPVSGTADVLDAELRIARGDFEGAARLVRPLTVRADDIGSRALVLATEATAGAGDLRAAEQFGEAAHARLGDDPALAVSYGAVLARRGRLEEALRLLDASAEASRAAGDEPLAARLAAQAADVAADLALNHGASYNDAVTRARGALAELRALGDQRAFVRAVDSLVGMVNVEHPHDALQMTVDAAREAEALGDTVALGRVLFRLCDIAIDLADRARVEERLPQLIALPKGALEEVETRLLSYTLDELVEPRAHDTSSRLATLAADAYAISGTSTPELDTTRICVELWQGRVSVARRLMSEAQLVPPQLATMLELQARILEGPPWSLDGIDVGSSTAMHNEVALMHLLRGSRQDAARLLIERREDRIADVGHAFQRFTPFFPGALVAPLGPQETEPDVEWLERWLHEPPFPGLWVVHRAIAGVLLFERSAGSGRYATAALALLAGSDADDDVRAWVQRRTEEALSQ